MLFNYGPECRTLTGLGEGSPAQISVAQLSHELHQGGINHFYHLELNTVAPEPLLDSSLDLGSTFQPVLTDLLNRYDDVFSQPRGLPPPRDADHYIPLLAETKPDNVRPY